MSLFSRIIFVFIAISFYVTIVSAKGWLDAHATFYGDMQGHYTEKGACGYDVFQDGYGLSTTALSTTLFEEGAKCGACYELMCAHSKWCKQGAGVVRVTATNLCPTSSDPHSWCNPPLHHFDLSEPMFINIAEYKGGIIPVKYRRIACPRRGGVKFQITGNPWFLLVLVYNVGDAGDVTDMKVMSSLRRDWVTMSRNWGMNWQVNGGGPWLGQGLTFLVTISNGRTLQFDNVVPPNWSFGQSFEGRINF
ncbi:expansin-A25-like [Silene latifolia]|uniref:expansin-A25-like n=1 Tax=Silene latifolia TaxID=37657 RepID=UPI003D77A6B3